MYVNKSIWVKEKLVKKRDHKFDEEFRRYWEGLKVGKGRQKWSDLKNSKQKCIFVSFKYKVGKALRI